MNSTQLIANIKRRASIPSSQNLFQNEDFLAFANDVIQTDFIPLILSLREEYFVTYKDYSITANQESYSIPSRSIGSKVRDIQLIDSSGNVKSLTWLIEENRTSNTLGEEGFYIRGNKILLSPVPTQTLGTLRVFYYLRPNSLVETTEAYTISSIDTVNNQVTLSSIDTTWTSGSIVDFIKSSSHYETLGQDYTITGVSGNTLTFSSLPSDITVNDLICNQNETSVIQLPEEFHSAVAQSVATRCLEAMGESQGKIQLAQKQLDVMMESLKQTLSPRVDGENKKILPNGLLSTFVWR